MRTLLPTSGTTGSGLHLSTCLSSIRWESPLSLWRLVLP